MPTININKDETKNIDLGNSTGMNISVTGSSSAKVHIDYFVGRAYTSAVTGSSGLGNPITIRSGDSKAIAKSDLESETVRVGVRDSNISVTY